MKEEEKKLAAEARARRRLELEVAERPPVVLKGYHNAGARVKSLVERVPPGSKAFTPRGQTQVLDSSASALPRRPGSEQETTGDGGNGFASWEASATPGGAGRSQSSASA